MSAETGQTFDAPPLASRRLAAQRRRNAWRRRDFHS